MHQFIRASLTHTLCTLLVLLLPMDALTAQSDAGRTLLISATALNFGYQEFNDNGRRLNQETGVIPGLVLRIGQGDDHWRVVGDVSYYAGDVEYDGQTNRGTPVMTRTNQKIIGMGIHAEYWQASMGGLHYALYFGAGYSYRERDIQPTRTTTGSPVSGLFETYQWWSGFLGAKSVLYTSERGRWLLDARFTRPVNPSMKVDFDGLNDSVRLDMGGHWGVRGALPWHYTMSPSADFFIEPFMERYETRRSALTPLTRNGVLVGTVYEPRSESFNYGFMVGVQQRF